MSTQETPDWRSLLLQLLSVGLSVSLRWPTGVLFFFFFSSLSAHPPRLEKQYVFRPGAGLNLWPRQRFSWDPPSVGESLVEGLMVIWSTLLNESTQPLTDVQCEGSAVSSDPWICVDYEWGSNNRALRGEGQHALTKRASLSTSRRSLCLSSCFSWRRSKTFRKKKERKKCNTIVRLDKTPREDCGK